MIPVSLIIIRTFCFKKLEAAFLEAVILSGIHDGKSSKKVEYQMGLNHSQFKVPTIQIILYYTMDFSVTLHTIQIY